MQRIVWVVCVLVACGKSDTGIDNKPAQPSEAGNALDALARRAKAVFADTGKFPLGTSSILPARNGDTTVAGGCCGSKSDGATEDHKCPVSTAWGSDPVWKALGFHIDVASDYRFKYESADGKSFTATATGDADCDTQEAVFTISGTIQGGKPVVSLSLPPKGSY